MNRTRQQHQTNEPKPQINTKWTNRTDENSSTEWMNRMRRQFYQVDEQNVTTIPDGTNTTGKQFQMDEQKVKTVPKWMNRTHRQ
jgi:hypothetical protein